MPQSVGAENALLGLLDELQAQASPETADWLARLVARVRPARGEKPGAATARLRSLTAILALRPDIPDILSKVVAQRSEQNAAAYARLKELAGTNVAATICRENILKRFLRMLGR